ncbi:hypothetical protein B0H19DRAFT_1125535 [Mycena capillaripes]|nr:hypothetical protein B0H19DRAFT_1125535 [Mycena capillaripes]
MPPKGNKDSRTSRAIYSILSNRIPSIIEISSMMRVLVSSQRVRSLNEFLILRARRSLDSFPNPIPANECRVEPPMFRPAIPVDAVTARELGFRTGSSFKVLIISRKRMDFPVPAGPVKNTDFPATTMSKTLCCSPDSLMVFAGCNGVAGMTTGSMVASSKSQLRSKRVMVP